jgi:hypothetical protein
VRDHGLDTAQPQELVVGAEDFQHEVLDLFAQPPSALDPVLAAAVAQVRALLRQVLADRAELAAAGAHVRAQALVVSPQRDRVGRAARPHLLVQVPPRDGVEGSVDLHVAVAVSVDRSVL